MPKILMHPSGNCENKEVNMLRQDARGFRKGTTYQVLTTGINNKFHFADTGKTPGFCQSKLRRQAKRSAPYLLKKAI
ncbi:hypothetical protein [Mucilaginibacter rubeus]|uniref:Uncharacterized protein n=1 Tax=Mucilaginibacter rubeus TaxID=2027860 RepID=A0A5C1I2X9_9SPHI|nr:hypothetical protein [Mucilaginibacter rubeus]QEM11748.1 hypothetical protein DEO27_017520 [Mucilaginibacter rubeus]